MIPKELQERKQWICWKYENRLGRAKPTKVPYNPLTGFKASSVDSSTWTDFETAKAQMGKYSGIGFVFTKDDPYVGVDLDHVLDDNGNFIQKDAKEIFEKCGSYTEISPSGTGIHILGKAKLHDVAHKVEEDFGRGTCEKELYESGRYFTVTGNQMGSVNEIKDVQAVTNELEDVMVKAQKGRKKTPVKAAPQSALPPMDTQPREVQEDAVITYARSVFSQIDTSTEEGKASLYDKAVHIAGFLEDGEITKAIKDRDLFLTYTQQGQTKTAVIQDEGLGFQIPQEPMAQKEYLYAKLFRHLDKTNTWNMEKQPQFAYLHQGTQILIGEMEKVPGGSHTRKFFDGNALEQLSKQSSVDLWNEIHVDETQYPQISRTIARYESEGKKGILVSKEIIGMFVKGQARNKQKANESPKELKPALSDAYISTKSLAEFTWLSKRGISCIQIPSQNLGDKNYTNCALREIEISGSLENVTFKACQIEGVHSTESGSFKNVVMDSCTFAGQEDVETVQKLGAELKNCMIHQTQVSLGKENAAQQLNIQTTDTKVVAPSKATMARGHSERMER